MNAFKVIAIATVAGIVAERIGGVDAYSKLTYPIRAGKNDPATNRYVEPSKFVRYAVVAVPGLLVGYAAKKFAGSTVIVSALAGLGFSAGVFASSLRHLEG